jgi:hypothetical protein
VAKVRAYRGNLAAMLRVINDRSPHGLGNGPGKTLPIIKLGSSDFLV